MLKCIECFLTGASKSKTGDVIVNTIQFSALTQPALCQVIFLRAQVRCVVSSGVWSSCVGAPLNANVFSLGKTHRILYSCDHILWCDPFSNRRSCFVCYLLLTLCHHSLADCVFALIQTQILNKLSKRSRDSVGPPRGKKCVAFINDLNMPAVDKHGSQPPLELLRYDPFVHRNIDLFFFSANAWLT